MDHGRFGTLTTTLANATSRRAALRGVIAILAGGATATVADGASAATTCRRGRQTCSRNSQCCSGTCRTGREVSARDRNRCTCEGGLTLCGNACVETDTDVRNCGGCGKTCNAGDYCEGGHCRFHQECYTDETGACFMDARGTEIRFEGATIAPKSVYCNSNAECADFDGACALPGVTCTCVRAVDSGDGYREVDTQGNTIGICIGLLDSGDDGMTCVADNDSICLFTAAGDEMRVCDGASGRVGECIDYACDGVGPCDDDGVSCTCALAGRMVGMPFYINYLLGGPTQCFAYLTEGGPCPD
jgi:hypothetical protein